MVLVVLPILLRGILCPQSLRRTQVKIRDRLRDAIDQAIKLRDKLLVILSANSIENNWVEDEVEAALEEERRNPDRRTVLLPIMIDKAMEHTDRAWAQKIKRTRYIGDFTQWKDYDAYQKAFVRLLRDLQATDEREAEPPSSQS